MFFRSKKAGPRSYWQIVENRWEGSRARQRVIATHGRLDKLQADGELEASLRSGARRELVGGDEGGASPRLR